MPQVYFPNPADVLSHDGGKTVRQRIVESLVDEARNMVDGPNGDQPIWLNVFSGDASDLENNSAPFLSFEESEEQTIESYGGCTIKELTVILTFRWPGAKGLDANAYYKYYLGRLQKTFLPLHEDDTRYPYLRDIREESNAPSFLTQDDDFPAGSLVMILQYSHARNDPYRLAGE